MKDNLKDILQNLNKDVEQNELLRYLNRELSDSEQHDLEEVLANDEFGNDALEGLEALKNKENLSHTIEHLNKNLHKALKEKKRKRGSDSFTNMAVYAGIAIVLLLALLAYVIIKLKS